MSGSILLDTNITIDVLKNDEVTIKKLVTYNKVFYPIIAIAELIYRAYNAQNTSKKLSEVEKLKLKAYRFM